MVELHCGDFGSEIKHTPGQRAETGTDFDNLFPLRSSGFLDDPVKKIFIDQKVLTEFAAGFESEGGEQGGQFAFFHGRLNGDVRIRRVRIRTRRFLRKDRTPATGIRRSP